MEIVKKTDEYQVIKKRSGRYGVRNARRQWLKGDEKIQILVAEKLIAAPPPKKAAPEPPVAEAAPADEASGEESAAEAAAEDAASE